MKKWCVLLSVLLMLSGCSGREAAGQESAGSTGTSYTVLTLGSWGGYYELEHLVQQFNETHTDYQIECISYRDPSMDVDAALDRMNLQLVAGDVPDILYLSSMDVASLKNAGVLMDLTPLMESDPEFHAEDYFMNIWELFRENGKLYEFVPCFEIGGISGPAVLLGDRTGWTIPEYQTYASRWALDRPMLRASRDQMLSWMIQFSSEPYLNVAEGTCDFDNPEFVQLLEFVKGFPDGVPKQAVMDAGWVCSVSHFAQLEQEAGTPLRIVGFPEDSGGGPCAMSLSSFGISAKTEHAEICWEFLMTTLEDDAQREIWNGGMLGFPMRRESLDTLLREMTEEPRDVETVFWTLSVESRDYIPQLIESINRLRLRHQPILDIVTEEVGAYFQEDTAASHCARMVQSRVSIYLSEQQ